MYTSYFLFLVLFNGPIMDSERGPATAGPRIVYILSSGGLSVSALGLFFNSNSLQYYHLLPTSGEKMLLRLSPKVYSPVPWLSYSM